MAENEDVIVETLKDRGLTCAKLSSLVKKEFKEAASYRKLGFLTGAESKENTGKTLKVLKSKVCKLR